MDYYNEIKNKLIDNEVYSKLKDYSKEKHKVITYFEIGRLLNEAGSKYGNNIIDKYSKKLVIEVGKKYNKRTLFRMKQFYNVFSNQKVSTLSTQLSWSHYTELLPIKNEHEMLYYLNLCINQHIDVRTLRQKIKFNEYKRIPIESRNKLSKNETLKPNELIPNPIRIKNSNNYENISERILQRIILEDIASFLKELGNGFTFIDNEYPIKLGERYNYIDLLLYNIKYKCYVVIELKVTELRSEHTGQIMTDMNYIGKNVKTIEENDTVGIIICKEDNEYVIKYCSDDRIIAREYNLV